MTAIASCTLPDEAAPYAQQMRMLTDMADYAMRMARVAVEQYEASVAPTAEAATTSRRGLPCPGSLFIRAARVVQNCIAGYSRLAAGLPLARITLPRASVHEPATQGPATQGPAAEDSRAGPVRQALRTVTRIHPHGPSLLRAGLENLAAALTADPRRAADPPALFRHVCGQSGIHLSQAQERKAARDMACEIRAAPA